VADYYGKAWPITNLKTNPTLGTAVNGMSNPQGIAITPESAASTLTSAISTGQIYAVYSASITANWATLSNGLGYELDASTSASFTNITSSITTSLSVSTLTVQGLTSNTTYYLRVSGLDPTGTFNWLVLGSTETLGLLAPVNPSAVAVSSNSIQVSWQDPGGATGYEVDASTASNFTGVILSTLTANASATSLVVDSMTSLSADTTYYLRVGALAGGTTAYTSMLSTSTLTAPITNAQSYQIFRPRLPRTGQRCRRPRDTSCRRPRLQTLTRLPPRRSRPAWRQVP